MCGRRLPTVIAEPEDLGLGIAAGGGERRKARPSRGPAVAGGPARPRSRALGQPRSVLRRGGILRHMPTGARSGGGGKSGGAWSLRRQRVGNPRDYLWRLQVTGMKGTRWPRRLSSWRGPPPLHTGGGPKAKRAWFRGEYQEAYEAFQRAYIESFWLSHLDLAYTLPFLGRVDEAKQHVAALLKMYPTMTIREADAFYKLVLLRRPLSREDGRRAASSGLARVGCAFGPLRRHDRKPFGFAARDRQCEVFSSY